LLIAALKAKLASVGVCFPAGEVVGYKWRTTVSMAPGNRVQKRSQLTHVHMQAADGRVFPIQFSVCLNSAGADARSIARLAGIGTGEEALAYDVPIMSRFLPFILYC